VPADSAPYLRDGRAATIAEAVRMHGGEDRRSMEKFVALEQKDRDDLLLFLSALVAPDDPSLARPQLQIESTAVR
jgi:hypothetical protein